MNWELVHVILYIGLALLSVRRVRDHKGLRVLQLELERIAWSPVGLILLVSHHWRWVLRVLFNFAVFLNLMM